MDIDIVVRAAKQEDLDEVESLYNALNDYLAVHENYPRWKKRDIPAAGACRGGDSYQKPVCSYI